MNRYIRQNRNIYHALLILAFLWSAQSAHLLMCTTLATYARAPRQTAQISGHISPLVQQSKPVGQPAATMPLDHLEVFLTLRNQPSLDGLLLAQENLAAPQYHRYLSPVAFEEAFAPTQDTIDRVSTYLQAHGLHVISVAPNNLYIHISATVAAVEKAFALQINYYNIRGKRVYAPSTDPVVGETVAHDIQCIVGLDDVEDVYRSHAITAPASHAPFQGYAPTDLRTAYHATPLLASGAVGNGQAIALVEPDGYNASDVEAYRSRYHLGPGTYSTVLLAGTTTTPGPHRLEVEADMEIISALAPGAPQKIYIGPPSTPGFYETLNHIISNDREHLIDSSWTDCEPAFGPGILSGLYNILKESQAQGQAVFVGSGDQGAYGCGGTTLNVAAPADSPYVVSVGGTSLHALSTISNQHEAAWSNPAPTPGTTVRGSGGGGGISAYFDRPAYQNGPHLTTVHRPVPDVSANADPATGDVTYCSTTSSGCLGWQITGGTRLAAALWVGIAADINQYLSDRHQPTLGNVDGELYLLYSIPQPSAGFHDIITGTNLYYHASAGYDPATGLGTPDAWGIARDLAVFLPLVILCRGSDLSSTAHVAVLCRSASTNTPALVMRVNDDGSASLTTLPGDGLPNINTPLPRGTVSSAPLAALLKHIGDVTTIPEHFCLKPVSFATITTVTYHVATSSDLSCLTSQDPPDDYALWRMVDTILRPYVQPV